MKKAFGQTVRDLKRGVNKKVRKAPGIERKVLDATNNESWGPHGTLLADIAHASRNHHDYQLTMGVLWKRLADTGKNWRHVYKALIVLEYMVGHGPERVIDDIKERAYQVSTLADFQYIDSSGKDQGSCVRKMSQSLVALVNDKEKIVEAREKAAATRDKYRNSASGMPKPSGGFADKYDCEGGEREYCYRDDDRNSRDEDRYSRDSDDRYGRDGNTDDEHRGRSRSVDNYENRSRGRSSEKEQSFEDDGQSPSRVGMQRKFSQQNIGTSPPSYEEAMSESRSPAYSERDGGETPPVSAPEAAPPLAESRSDDNEAAPQQVEAFDEFDPRGFVSVGASAPIPSPPKMVSTSSPPASNNSEMDLLGSLSDVFSPNPLAIVTSDSTFAETNVQGNTTSAPSFSTSQSSTQPFDDPFGDAPFKATTSDNNDTSEHQSFGAPLQPTPPTSNPYNGHSFGFGETLSVAPNPESDVQNMQAPPDSSVFPQEEFDTSHSEIDILAGILPPSGPPVSSSSQNISAMPTSQFPLNSNMYETSRPQTVPTNPNMPEQTPFGQISPQHNTPRQTPFGQDSPQHNMPGQTPFGQASPHHNMPGGTPFGQPSPQHNMSGQTPFGQPSQQHIMPGQSPYGQPSQQHNMPGQTPYGQDSQQHNMPGQTPYGRASQQHNVPGQTLFDQASQQHNMPGQTSFGQASQQHNMPGQTPFGQASQQHNMSGQTPFSQASQQHNMSGQTPFGQTPQQNNMSWQNPSDYASQQHNMQGQIPSGHALQQHNMPGQISSGVVSHSQKNSGGVEFNNGGFMQQSQQYTHGPSSHPPSENFPNQHGSTTSPSSHTPYSTTHNAPGDQFHGGSYVTQQAHGVSHQAHDVPSRILQRTQSGPITTQGNNNNNGGMQFSNGGFIQQPPQYTPGLSSHPTNETFSNQPGSVTSSSSQTSYSVTPDAPGGQFDGGKSMTHQAHGVSQQVHDVPSQMPQRTHSGHVPSHVNNNSFTGDMFAPPEVGSLGTSTSQPSLTPVTGAIETIPQTQTQNQKKFEPKSTIWADTLSRGLVNFNISGPKTNPLADIGVDFAAINRKEKRLEKPTNTQQQVTSTINMGKAMGSGTGLGRAGASAMRLPTNSMVGSNTPMGMNVGGYGGMNQNHPMGMNQNNSMGMGMNMNQNYPMGMNMNQNYPMGMGMNMNQNQHPMGMGGMHMNMGGYGQGYPMQPQQGMSMGPGPQQGMNNAYNPMMGQGGYNPQQHQPYGGGYQ